MLTCDKTFLLLTVAFLLVFKVPARNQQWKQQPQQLPQQQAGHSVNSTFNQSSPASYGQGSPGYTRHTPQGSPAQPASARLVVPVDKSRPPFHEPNSIPQRASVIAGGLEQNRSYNDLNENKLNPNWQKLRSDVTDRAKGARSHPLPGRYLGSSIK